MEIQVIQSPDAVKILVLQCNVLKNWKKMFDRNVSKEPTFVEFEGQGILKEIIDNHATRNFPGQEWFLGIKVNKTFHQ